MIAISYSVNTLYCIVYYIVRRLWVSTCYKYSNTNKGCFMLYIIIVAVSCIKLSYSVFTLYYCWQMNEKLYTMLLSLKAGEVCFYHFKLQSGQYKFIHPVPTWWHYKSDMSNSIVNVSYFYSHFWRGAEYVEN